MRKFRYIEVHYIDVPLYYSEQLKMQITVACVKMYRFRVPFPVACKQPFH